MKLLKKTILIFILLTNVLLAKSDYFNEGVNLFNEKKFKEAQFKFYISLKFLTN